MKLIRLVKLLKLGVSLGVILCMFIPLSQCTYHPYIISDPEEKSVSETVPKELKVHRVIIIEKFSDLKEIELESIWIYLTFFMPLIFCIPIGRGRISRAIVISFQSLFFFWLCFFVYLAVYQFDEPLIGGYIFTALSLLFGLVTAFEWRIYVDKYKKSKQAGNLR